MDTIAYLQQMKQFFIKKGNKTVMEKLFHTFLMNRAQSKKGNLTKTLSDSMLNSMPHIRLRTRRRGKRTLYRVNFMQNEESVRKALLAFSKNLNENKNPKFLISLEKELEVLGGGKSIITTKRDALHRLAIENIPYSWRKKKIIKRIKINKNLQ